MHPSTTSGIVQLFVCPKDLEPVLWQPLSRNLVFINKKLANTYFLSFPDVVKPGFHKARCDHNRDS